jgi:hypothetical protein
MTWLVVLALLATLIFAISGIFLITVLIAAHLRDRRDRRDRALARDEHKRRERYGEHLAAQNSRPHTNAVTHIATRHRQ